MDAYRSAKAEKKRVLKRERERNRKRAKPGRACSAFWRSSSATAQREPNHQSLESAAAA